MLGRHRHHGRLGLAEEAAVVAYRGAAEPRPERLGARRIDVGNTDEFAIGAGGELLRVVAPHVAGAEYRDGQ
jgi:hypothetical protein